MGKSQAKRIKVQKGLVSDERLKEVLDFKVEYNSKLETQQEFDVIVSALKELQSYRKGIKQAVEEIEREKALLYEKRLRLIDEGKSATVIMVSEKYAGLTLALDIVCGHLPKDERDFTPFVSD